MVRHKGLPAASPEGSRRSLSPASFRPASNIGYSTVHRTVSLTPMPVGFESLIMITKKKYRQALNLSVFLWCAIRDSNP